MTVRKNSSKKTSSSTPPYYKKAKQNILQTPRTPKQLSVIVHFDLPHSTKEIVKEPHETITKMLMHNNICMQIIKKYGGKPIKELGDAVLSEFMFLPQAILCAKEAISYLKNLKCNIGTKVSICVGRIEKTKKGQKPDIYGIPVNLCSRMASIVDEDCIIVEESHFKKNVPLFENTPLTLHSPTSESFHGFPRKIKVRQIQIC